jgi:hypothetical protein
MRLIGVPINESKSVVSLKRPVVEFAKRTSFNGKEVSPYSFKMLMSSVGFRGRISDTISIIKRAVSFPFSNVKPSFIAHTMLKSTV